MGSLNLPLQWKTVQIFLSMKVLAGLTLALAISYVKADGAHSHDHAPAPAPEPSYGAPAPSYGAPEASYGEPVSYEEEGGSDIIVVVIVAILALVGLSLLFPTFVRINDVNPSRKKREAEEIARSDFMGRTAEIYDHLNEVLEPVDRRCVEKITCEVGTLSYDAGISSNPFFKLVAPFVPGKYEKYMKHFIYPNNCHKIKCNAYY